MLRRFAKPPPNLSPIWVCKRYKDKPQRRRPTPKPIPTSEEHVVSEYQRVTSRYSRQTETQTTSTTSSTLSSSSSTTTTTTSLDSTTSEEQKPSQETESSPLPSSFPDLTPPSAPQRPRRTAASASASGSHMGSEVGEFPDDMVSNFTKYFGGSPDVSHEEREQRIMEENIEHGGKHWSLREFRHTMQDVVHQVRPPEVKRMLEQSKPPEKNFGLKIQPVVAGGPAYPIFYDPKKGIDRPQARIPNDPEARRNRVAQIYSIKKATGLEFSDIASVYDLFDGDYYKTISELRNRQAHKLAEATGKPVEKCADVLDDCVGNYDKALKKLKR